MKTFKIILSYENDKITSVKVVSRYKVAKDMITNFLADPYYALGKLRITYTGGNVEEAILLRKGGNFEVEGYVAEGNSMTVLKFSKVTYSK